MNSGIGADVIVLYNVTETLAKGEAQDLVAEQGVVLCAQAVLAALAERGYAPLPLPVSAGIEQALANHPAARSVIFNLAEGLGGRLFEEARIAFLLDAMGYTFTGGDGHALAVAANKARAKGALAAAGIPTPTARVYAGPDSVPAGPLAGPLIVKPVAEDASQGIDEHAVVTTATALRERVAYITERYCQAALAEAFIDGREFNIAVWGYPEPEVLPLAEVDLSAFERPLERIINYATKWIEDSFGYARTPVTCPANVGQHWAPGSRTWPDAPMPRWAAATTPASICALLPTASHS